MGVPGRIRQRQRRVPAPVFRRPPALVAERGQRPAAPPNCSASASLRSRCSRVRERCRAAAYSASFRPNGIGSACCSQVRATTAVLRCLPREFGKAGDGAVEIGQQRIDRGAQGQHRRGIDHVLAGGAPMHIARGLGVGLGDSAVSALTSGIARLPERVAASASAARSNASALQAAAIGPAALAGNDARWPLRRAPARLRNRACAAGRPHRRRRARMAALDSIGASRGEREVLMMRAT